MKWIRAAVMILLSFALLLGSASCGSSKYTQHSSSTGNTNTTPSSASPRQFTISDVTTSAISASSVTIVWTTNAPATSEVEYGLTTDYGSATSLDLKLVTRHSVKVTGLGPHTYHYRARSVDVDGSGNVALSGDYSVTMPGTKPMAANVSVYCIGDSITYQGDCSPPGRYETTLQSLLNTSPNETWIVYNEGVNGNTTAQMLARFNTDVISHSDCQYVIIWGGINDVQLGYDVSIPEVNLQSMFTQAHNAGIKVVSLNVTPLNAQYPGRTLAVERAAIKDINSWIANGAMNVDYKIDIYSVLAIPDPNNPGYDAINSAYTNDGLHLNCVGYDLVANVVFHDVTWPVVH